MDNDDLDAPWLDSHVRVKKGVSPFGGKVLRVWSSHTYPNGRFEIGLIPYDGVQSLLGPLDTGARSYAAHEIEKLPAKRLKWWQDRDKEVEDINHSQRLLQQVAESRRNSKKIAIIAAQEAEGSGGETT
tara:strand:- start:2763 stop:3149 length:387 start_codon:yes stop_codon:yes gene_type:complete